MRTLFTLILATLLLAIPAIASEDNTGTEEGISTVVLWDNGPFITSYGTGFDGADESVLHESNSTRGWKCRFSTDLRLGDDFEVPEGEIWEITSITLYAYKTEGGVQSHISGAYIEILDGPPETGTSAWGDLSTNVMTSTSFTNVYRVRFSDQCTDNTYRPISASVSEFSSPITLTAGTYFLCWLHEGIDNVTLYNPAVTIDGVVETGNALAYEYETWVPVVDGESKGFPFIIEGTSSSAL
ncbi:MAG: hypothetical protein K8S24_03615 [Candidatus Aegiribacteria sp.]|nr:hypothetical protein [Candidatus Aegiribacteria sp.]